jgi:hypothetical protein
MSFGIPVRNGLAIGLGTLAPLATEYFGAPQPLTGCLLQEDGSRILQEDDFCILLEPAIYFLAQEDGFLLLQEDDFKISA